jgi:hypothetical protein
MSALYFSIRINRIASFQWINRELKRLEKEINLAHEKGWHKEYPLQIDTDIMSWENNSAWYLDVVFWFSFTNFNTFPLNRNKFSIMISSLTDLFATMGELMDKKKLLSTPAERQRRHEVVREIVADVEDEKETKLKITAGNSCQVNTGTIN